MHEHTEAMLQPRNLLALSSGSSYFAKISKNEKSIAKLSFNFNFNSTPTEAELSLIFNSYTHPATHPPGHSATHPSG